MAYVNEGGDYDRDQRYLTTRITANGRDGFPVEPGRYRLVVSRACPWANRATIVRRLLGLEDVLSMAIAGPTHDGRSWTFDLDPGGRDPVLGIERLQEAYEKAYHRLFNRLDWLSARLERQRYLVGDTITEADVRLFTTLVRFDAVYHGHFKCNRHKLAEMPVLWAYARDLFTTPGFGDTIDFDHIKRHYYEVHRDINPTGIVPAGPDLSAWTTPHERERFGGQPYGDGTPPLPPRADETVPKE